MAVSTTRKMTPKEREGHPDPDTGTDSRHALPYVAKDLPAAVDRDNRPIGPALKKD